MSTIIKTVRALKDNYCYIIHREGSNEAAVIDASEAEPINLALKEAGLTLRLILNTHHHHDHVGANLELKEKWKAKVVCSETDFKRVPAADLAVHEGESFSFDGNPVKVLAIPGHTQGQIAYWFREAHALFVGDTVFSMGCGRLLEGTPEQMWHSLQRIMNLPPLTQLYFGHEYTDKNASFAVSVEPQNPEIQKRVTQTQASLQEKGFAPAPTLQDELLVNPFFRLRNPEIKRNMNLDPSASELEVFTELRRRRDSF